MSPAVDGNLTPADRPANASDNVVLIPDIDACLALYRDLSPKYFLGDRGYDALNNLEHLVNLGMVPVVAIRRPPKDKETGKPCTTASTTRRGTRPV